MCLVHWALKTFVPWLAEKGDELQGPTSDETEREGAVLNYVQLEEQDRSLPPCFCHVSQASGTHRGHSLSPAPQDISLTSPAS